MATAKSDFDPNQLVKLNEDLTGLVGRIENLEEKFGTHEQIADTLCETANKATRMKAMLSESFVDLIQHNPDIKKELKKAIDEIDRNSLIVLGGKIGFGVWSILLIIITAIVTKYFVK